MATLTDSMLYQPTTVLLLASICLYYVSVVFYRLYLSPLAKFPGPRLAALTFWVEFYHDVVRRGQYTFEIVKMHEKYAAKGPIVRITPDELHINDKDHYDEVYPGSHKPTDKSPASSGAFGSSLSVLSTVPHSLHKMRRGVLNPFFSRRSVMDYTDLIQSSVSRLCGRLEEMHTSENLIDLRVAFAALTSDIISMYSFGKSYGSLEKPDLDPGLHKSIASGGELALLLNQCPWILKTASFLPYWLVALLNDNVTTMIKRQKDIQAQVQGIMAGDGKDCKAAHSSPTVFHKLLKSDIPHEERSISRLIDEGITLIGAGTVTTAHVLSTTAYHVLANTEILARLQRELQETMLDGLKASTQTPLAQLQQLPYLTAIIKEGLRLTHAISHRNARVAPGRSLKFRQWTIPPGTAVSMTTYMLHTDPAVFPMPQEFRPERWLQSTDEGASVSTGSKERFLLPFGKGSRICLGMNLAYAELYMTLAAVFRGFELQLFETTREDVEMVHDFVVGSARLDSKGVRVLVRKRHC